MIRIILPLAIIAAIFFGPMFSVTTTDSVRGESVSTVTGDYLIGNAVDCVRKGQLPIGEECASDGEMQDSKMVGNALSWASVLAGLAAVLGVPGMLPFVGRLTSIVTLASGLGALGAMGLFLTTMMGSEAGLGGVGWGAYLASGAALLTTISGLSGMRGR